MMAALLVLLAACTESAVDDSTPSLREMKDYKANLTISTPSYSKIESRSGTFSHEGIASANDMKLLCFDAKGYFVGLAKDLDIENVTEGEVKENGGTEQKKITATVPAQTARLHIIANAKNVDFSKEAEWMGRHENNLVTSFETENPNDQAGKTVYWGYVKKNSAEEMYHYLNDETVKYHIIHLLRDRAKIDVDFTDSSIESIRFAVGNVMKYGTVAPFNRDSLCFPQTNLLTAERWKAQCTYITPSMSNDKSEFKFSTGREEMWPQAGEDNQAPMNYSFEHKNSYEDPLKVILEVKYKNRDGYRWFQILIQNNGVQIPIKRNHIYKIHIEKLAYNLGFSSEEAAYKGTPANNPWIKVEDIVQEISNGTYTLDIVNGTYHLLTAEAANTTQTLDFTYSGDKDKSMTANDFNASWTMNKDFSKKEDNQKTPDEPTVSYDAATGKGTITYQVGKITDERKDAIIKLVDKKHGLTRNIHLYSISQLDYKPQFAESMNAQEGATADLSLNIPEAFPDEMLPVEIKIASSNVTAVGSDIKVESTADVDGGEGWDCWYVVKFDKKGSQKITLRNVRTGNGQGRFYIKAPFYNGGKAKEVIYNYTK